LFWCLNCQHLRICVCWSNQNIFTLRHCKENLIASTKAAIPPVAFCWI
jgi:hypothetical protein